MTEEHMKRIVICDTQPIVAEGLRNLLGSEHGLEFLGFVDSLDAASQFVRFRNPDLVLVDKGFGMQMVLDWLHELRLIEHAPAPIVWGVSRLRLNRSGCCRPVRAGFCAKPPD